MDRCAASGEVPRMRRGSTLRRLCRLTAGWMAILSIAVGYVQAADPPQAALPASVSPQRALLNRYCVTCHNERTKTAGLTLDTLDVANVAPAAEVWEKVVRKLRAGAMPPAGQSRPDSATQAAFVSWLETTLDQVAAAQPNPGRTEPFHRLNRTEYQNVIRDVLAVEGIDIASLLPGDDSSYGFDNIAGVLGLSPTLFERYLSAARKISRLAVGDPAIPLTSDKYRVREDLAQDSRLDDLPFGTRGGTVIRRYFPLDAEYVFTIVLEGTVRLTAPHRLEVSVDGERVHLFTLGEKQPLGDAGYRPEPAMGNGDQSLQLRLPIRAGLRRVDITFLNKTSVQAEDLLQPLLRPMRRSSLPSPSLRRVTISGPFQASGASDTPSRRRIFVCRPGSRTDEMPCAKRILSNLTRRAYREPMVEADVQMLLPFYITGRTEGGFDRGIQRAIERMLVSPKFLVRIERDPANVPANTPYRISDVELASRLSFFLWSTIPDDELLDLAAHGRLNEPAVLERQVRRMLADARSQAFVSNFAGQWLYLRNLSGTDPNQVLFPDFDDGLRQAFRRETELLVQSILHEDRSVLDLLNANYTFLNERLARHYGIPHVYGSHFRRVTLSDGQRSGLLGHGSILTVTSYATRTSPVLRGKWILENILGTPPPPPPPNVPALQEKDASDKPLSMREAMVQHRANPVCAGCHRPMDPLGLALENFDAVGSWRTRSEAGRPLDVSGTLPDGTAFDGVAGLRQVLLSHPESFLNTVTEKLLTYALGRGVESYDAPTVRTIVREASRSDYAFSSLIFGVVKSVPFQMRRSQS